MANDYPKPNPVCVACGKEMHCVRNGAIIENGSVQWRGDQYECPKCGIAVVATFGDGADLTGPRDFRMIHVDNL